MLAFIYVKYKLYGKIYEKECLTWDEAHAEIFNPDCTDIVVHEYKYDPNSKLWMI